MVDIKTSMYEFDIETGAMRPNQESLKMHTETRLMIGDVIVSINEVELMLDYVIIHFYMPNRIKLRSGVNKTSDMNDEERQLHDEYINDLDNFTRDILDSGSGGMPLYIKFLIANKIANRLGLGENYFPVNNEKNGYLKLRNTIVHSAYVNGVDGKLIMEYQHSNDYKTIHETYEKFIQKHAEISKKANTLLGKVSDRNQNDRK